MQNNSSASNLQKKARKILKALASVKLAVVIIAALTILVAIGTIIESKYDATAAQKWVYRSYWMYAVLGMLAVSLIAVMVDRWPWKPRHSAFVCAHIGILILMLGQYITGTYGLDGSLRVEVGKNNRFVNTSHTDLTVYSSFDGTNYTKMYEQEVDFFLHRPQKEAFALNLDVPLKFVQYEPYVVPKREVIVSQQPRAGSGIRFQVKNPNVNVIEWIVQRNPSLTVTHDFGPAQIHLGALPHPLQGRGKNEMFLQPDGDRLKFVIFSSKDTKPIKQGVVQEGQQMETGWMNLQFHLLRYMPKAEEKWEINPRETPTPLTTSAVKIQYRDQEHWLLLNDTIKLFSQEAVYFVTYGNRRIDMGFPLTLKEFKMDKYQGTMRAASYASHVSVPEINDHIISMNEPLKYNGLTIYQASFQEGPTGEPVASIFSVNYDPGRWLKYLGCLIMVVGIILLFYFKKLGTPSSKKNNT